MRHGLALCLILLGCGSRPAGQIPDSVSVGEHPVRRDAPLPDRRADAPTACTTLAPSAQVSLELADTMKLGPRIVFDGEGFALVWHSQLAIVSSLNGELRFARVDLAGKPSTTTGVPVASDNGTLRAALAARDGKYTIVHQEVSPAEPGVEYRQVDGTGKMLTIGHVLGSYLHAAIAPHPLGHTLLLAGKGNPQLVVMQDTAGPPVPSKPIQTAQVMASVWLGERTKGFAAGLFTTNANATLYLVDPSLGTGAQGSVGHGALIASPSFAVRDHGFAALYGNGSTVEAEVFDEGGQRVGNQAVGTLVSPLKGSQETALEWTGSRLIAIYPGPGPGQYRARVLDAAGVPLGPALAVPLCLATAREVAAAWGNGVLAVAAVNESSGVMQSSVCVTTLVCN
jgi:hypothetical protein